MWTWAIELGKAALVAGLFAYLIQSGQLRFEDLAGIGDRWPWLLVAQIPFSLLLLAAALRWHLLLRAQAVGIAFRDSYALMLIGWFFNQAMPVSTGGDVAKAAAIGMEQPDRRTAAITSIVVDRFTGLLTLLAFACGFSLLARPMIAKSALLTTLSGAITLLLLSATVSTGLFFSTRVRSHIAPLFRWLGFPSADAAATDVSASDPGRARFLRRLARALAQIEAAVFAYRGHPRTLALCFATSLGLHTMTLVLNLLLTWIVLGESFAWLPVMVIIPMAHIGMAVPLTPGGIGVGEGIYGALFSVIGIGQGSTIALLQRLVWWIWAAIGAAIFLTRRKTGRTQLAALEP